MEPFTTLRTKVVPLLRNNVDTDQIIPARFLKVTDKHGLGEHLFADWRYRPDGAPEPGCVLNLPEHQGAQALLGGENFGCGSSREHAPWALVDWGFKAIVALSFADIFAANALKNGLLPIAVDRTAHARLRVSVAEDPAAEIAVDLAARTLHLPDGSEVTFSVDAFAARCLLEGIDELGYLRSFEEQIAAYERKMEAARARRHEGS
jgi:3-isopropylmalate/(R)-2-methylmalate dehydratase small subunit